MIRHLRHAAALCLPLTALILVASCGRAVTEKAPAPSSQEDDRAETADPFDPGLRDGTALFAFYLSESDAERAWSWLCAAALKGHPVAQNTIATRYRYGQAPVDRDPVRAYLWYSQALTNRLAAADALRSDLSKEMTPAALSEARASAKTWKPGGCQHFGG